MRFLLAALAASVILVVSAGLGLMAMAWGFGSEIPSPWASAVHVLFFTGFFGLPVAFVGTLVIGVTIRFSETKVPRRFSRLVREGIPAALCSMGFPAVWLVFWGRPFAPWYWAGVGALAGWIAGWIAWRITDVRDPSQTVG